MLLSTQKAPWFQQFTCNSTSYIISASRALHWRIICVTSMILPDAESLADIQYMALLHRWYMVTLSRRCTVKTLPLSRVFSTLSLCNIPTPTEMNHAGSEDYQLYCMLSLQNQCKPQAFNRATSHLPRPGEERGNGPLASCWVTHTARPSVYYLALGK